jgi:hypothetical protein
VPARKRRPCRPRAKPPASIADPFSTSSMRLPGNAIGGGRAPGCRPLVRKLGAAGTPRLSVTVTMTTGPGGETMKRSIYRQRQHEWRRTPSGRRVIRLCCTNRRTSSSPPGSRHSLQVRGAERLLVPRDSAVRAQKVRHATPAAYGQLRPDRSFRTASTCGPRRSRRRQWSPGSSSRERSRMSPGNPRVEAREPWIAAHILE